MKLLGIVCSPRLHGNTEMLVQEVLDSAKQCADGAKLTVEVELVTLAQKSISFCDGCRSCDKTGKCKIDDDMQQIYLKLSQADGIVIGSPVYFWTVSGQAKTFIDRTIVFTHGRKLRGKVGGAVITTNRSGETGAFQVFLSFFSIQRMINAGGVFAFGGRTKGGVREDPRAWDEARALGRVMIKYMHRAATSECIEALEHGTPQVASGTCPGEHPQYSNAF